MIRATMQSIRIGRRFPILRVLLITALSTIAPVVSSAVNLVVINPGFEDISGESPSNEFTFGPLNGWDLYEDPINLTAGGAGPTYFLGTLTPFEADPIGNPGVFVNFPAGAPEGQRVGITFNFFGSGGQGEWGFFQLLADTLQPNMHYTLEVRIGNIASGTSMGGTVLSAGRLPGLPGRPARRRHRRCTGHRLPDGQHTRGRIRNEHSQPHHRKLTPPTRRSTRHSTGQFERGRSRVPQF